DMLICRALGSPSAHAKLKGIDVKVAERVPGVVLVHVLQPEGYEINWQGDLLAVVAAETEAAAREGVSKIKLDLEELDVFVSDEDLEAAEKAGRTSAGGGKAVTEKEPGEDDDEDEFIEK